MSSQAPPSDQPPKPENEPNEPKVVGSRKSFWGWIAAAVIAVGAAITGLATFTSSISALWEHGKAVLHMLPSDETAFALRDVKKVFHRPPGPAVKGHADDYEVLIEAVTSRTTLKQCEADLDIKSGSSIDYLRGLTPNGSTDQQNVSNNGLLRFTFYIPKKDFPEHGELRLRCNGGISGWTNVNWPIDRKTETYQVCIGEDAGRCAGQVHLSCGATVENWAKATHSDICRNIKSYKQSSIDGGRCGYAYFQVTCSNIPIDD